MKLSDKQNEYIVNSNHRWNLKVGAVRSGKSFVDISFIIPSRIRTVSGLPGLVVIMGVSRDTIERNVLEPMRELYGESIVGTINSKNQALVCGEWVYCLGAEKVNQVAKIQGSSIKYCYGDEVAKWNREVFELLKSRLDKPYSKFDGALNPESPNHWLKKFIEQKNLDIYIQHYIIDDNPFLPSEYVENLKKEYEGTVYYDRYILGLWALAEGLIYPMYKDALVDELPDCSVMDYSMSIDYGTMNAFSATWHEKFENGIWYSSRNYYYSGRDTGAQKTDQDYLLDVERLIGDYIESLPEGKKIEVIIDPSAASFIALLRKTRWAKVRPADNAVLDGIRETASCLQQGKLKILSTLKHIVDEFEGYVWDESSGEDKPIKVKDHCLTGDTLVMTDCGEIPIYELVGTTGNVWSYDIGTGRAELKPYNDCRMTQKQVPVWELKTKTGKTIKGTIDHLILTKSGWLELGKCTFECVQMMNGGFEEVVSVRKVGEEAVYNMEVQDNHNFAINGGLIVHNCMDDMRYFVKTKKIIKNKRRPE